MSKYIVGIDLGTTNTSISYLENKEESEIQVLPILQLVKSGQIEARVALPSFIYLYGNEIAKEKMKLPWGESPYCVGEFAQAQGCKVPSRLVSSSKSWLCHRGVDRKSPILPFQAPDDVSKISPVMAQTQILLHLKNCWNYQIGASPENCLENQEIYLTVPASFDAVARDLTVTSARDIGLNVTLLEEPQAAFYSWIYHNQADWRKKLATGDLVLVVDVGGGTTDLCLISVQNEQGNLSLVRTAVGEHILLGGDNMDGTLAHIISSQFPKNKMDIWQSYSLWQTCREAKEKMLGDDSISKLPITVLGSGSSVIAGTLKTQLTRDILEKTLLDGFFPKIPIDDIGEFSRKIGFTELNLPYSTEPAITRHIARFLMQVNKEQKNEKICYPSAILFNGGVFQAKKFQEQIISLISSWANTPVKILENNKLDVAVSTGAVYYGYAKRGKAIRIRSGTSRSYYIGIQGLRQAIPGYPIPLKALCVVPFGMEEGSELDVPQTKLSAVIGESVEFPFFASNQQKKDEIGYIHEEIPVEMENIAKIETKLDIPSSVESSENLQDVIPVQLHSKVTEIGTVEISCNSLDKKHSWKLEFNIRG